MSFTYRTKIITYFNSTADKIFSYLNNEINKKTLVTIIILILTNILSVFTNSFLAKTIGLSVYGNFQLIISISDLLFLVILFGWPMLLIRSISSVNDQNRRQTASRLFSKSFQNVLTFTIIMCFFIYLIRMFFHQYSWTKFTPYIICIAFLKAVSELLYAVFQGYKKVILSKVLSGIMLPVVILTGIYIWSQNIFFKNNFFIIYCFLLTLTTVFLFFICKNLVGFKTHII